MKNFSRILVISAAVAVASAANAADIELKGNTTGSAFTFNPGSGTGLSYQVGNFDIFSVGQTYSLGSTTTGVGAFGESSLGTFTLLNVPGSYSGTFSLLVNFSLPTNITPPGTPTYQAILSGTLTTTGSNVFIDFDNNDQTFGFTGPGLQHGIFTLHVQDVNVGFPSGGSSVVALSGGGRVTTVPGPGALAAFGFGALANVRRRRRSSK